MQTKCLRIGELNTNCYLVWDKETGEGIIIDPADEANYLSEQILEFKMKPLAIILTHGHFDHCLAANELQMAFNIPTYLNQKDHFLLKRLSSTAEHFLGREIVEKPPQKLKWLKEGEEITFGEENLKVIHTPGHSPGGICLYSPKEKVLFSGDTLFAHGTVGRTDFSYGSEKALNQSLKKLAKLPKDTIIYPGHGHTETVIQIPNIGEHANPTL